MIVLYYIANMETIQALLSDFKGLDSDAERLEYLIELGKNLPKSSIPDEFIVPGCASRVWARSIKTDGLMHFDFASDSSLIRGLLYILRVALEGKTPQEINNINIHELFEKMGFMGLISANRQVGIKSI